MEGIDVYADKDLSVLASDGSADGVEEFLSIVVLLDGFFGQRDQFLVFQTEFFHSYLLSRTAFMKEAFALV